MKNRKNKRGRLKTAADTLEQLRQIENAQQAVRKAGKPHKINSIKKSKNRFKNAVKNLRTPEDFQNEFQ